MNKKPNLDRRRRWNPWGQFILLVTILSLYFLGISNAMMMPVTAEELVAGSDLICLVQVKGIRSYWKTASGGHRWMESEVDLEIAEYIKGKGPSQLTIKMLGGKVGEIELRNSVAPWFEEGEQAVVFLKEEKRSRVYSVFKQHLGKYSIDGNIVRDTGDRLDQFVDKIEALMKGLKENE